MQKSIHQKLLLLIGPGPAEFYKDACFLMSQSPPLGSTTHLVGHLLRDIESALRDVLEPLVEPTKGTDGKDKHKAQILAILSYLDIAESDPITKAWLKLAGKGSDYTLHARAHRKDSSEPRPVDLHYIHFWDDYQTILRIILDRFETHYTSVFDAIDKALVKSKPNAEDAKQLRNHIPNNLATWSYFFEKLPGPIWLTPSIVRIVGK